jgi:hypothetical protein
METPPLLLSDARSHESGAIASGVTGQRAAVVSHCSNRRVGATDPRRSDVGVRWAAEVAVRMDASGTGTALGQQALAN